MKFVADTLFEYLRDVLYDTENASLNVDALPEDFQDLGKGIIFFADCIIEIRQVTQALSRGEFNFSPISKSNEIAAPLKSLNASLRHLSWQAKQIAQGDYTQRVDFMGEFSNSFNEMVFQLAERQSILEEKAYKDSFTQAYNRAFAMNALEKHLISKKCFVIIFVDLDNLKYINDEFGHKDGDLYILNAVKHLKNFSKDALVCRIGGDEFLLLDLDISYEEAHKKMTELGESLKKDESLKGKEYNYGMSFGLVFVASDNTMPASEILSMADERMYEHKRERKRLRKTEQQKQV